MTHAPLSPSQQNLAEELTDALRPRMERLLQEVAACSPVKPTPTPSGPPSSPCATSSTPPPPTSSKPPCAKKKRLPGSCHSLPRLRPSRRLPRPSPALRREPVRRPVVRARLLLLRPLRPRHLPLRRTGGPVRPQAHPCRRGNRRLGRPADR